MFEVTILKKGTPLPAVRPAYLMTKNGLMLVKGNQVFDAIVPVKQVSFLQEVQQSATYKLPPISQAVFYKVWRLFREVYKKHQSEVNIFLYYDLSKQEYFFIVPRQNVSGASTDSHDPADQIPGALLVGTIHSHASMSAFHSGTDDRDEAFFDGLHITIGNLNDKDSFDISSSLMINSTRFKFDDPMKVIAGIRVCPPKAPKTKTVIAEEEKQPADQNTAPAPPPAPVENIRTKAGKKRRFLTAGTRHNGVYAEFFVPDAEYSRYQIAKFGGYWYLPDPQGDEVLWYGYSWFESFRYMFHGMTYPELSEKPEMKQDYYGTQPKKYYPDYGKKANHQPQPEFLDGTPTSTLPSAKPVTGNTWANSWSPKKHWEFIPEDVEALEKTIDPAEMEAWLAKVTGPFKASNLWSNATTVADSPADANRKPAVPPTDGQPKSDDQPNEKK